MGCLLTMMVADDAMASGSDHLTEPDPIKKERVTWLETQLAENETTDPLAPLKKGCNLTKVRRKGKTYSRHYKMEGDMVSFGQTDSKKFNAVRKLFRMKTGGILVYISDIKDVRVGTSSDTFVYIERDPSTDPDRCFTIVHGAKQKTLDLMAPDKATRDAWVTGLQFILEKLENADLNSQQALWFEQLFREFDVDKDDRIASDELIAVLKKLNFEVEDESAKEIVKEKFEEACREKGNKRNKRNEPALTMDEFLHFFQLMTRWKELEDLYKKYVITGKYLSPLELRTFFAQEEHDDLTLERCKELIQKFEYYPGIKDQQMMSLDGFNMMMGSRAMDIFNIAHTEVYQDMTQPLSQYWINSSHNTYLTADQLIGPSATDQYVRVVRAGCRCVELDCWDGDDGEPVVYHGHTLTSKIMFQDCCQSIADYCFERTEYPLILSLENHCSIDQQKKMAHYIKKYFADSLYAESKDYSQLPSPEELKGRVIVKAKKLPADIDVQESADVSDDEDEAADLENVEDEAVKKNLEEDKKKKTGKIKLARELSDLVCVCISVKFKGFDYAKENYKCTEMSSYGESKAFDLVDSSAKEFINLNHHQLSRIYPGGTRTDSSNYDPCPPWNCGCQIVALNFQTHDEPMYLNRSRFRDNGGSGYLLQPRCLRFGDSFHPEGPYPPEWAKKFKLKVIAGHQIPHKEGTKDILDPYVEVSIHGVKQDCQSSKTHVIPDNGFDPRWDVDMEFDVAVPDLAILLFRVYDSSYGTDEMVSQYGLPFTSVTTGYRTVNLANHFGQKIFGASLFVHVTIT